VADPDPTAAPAGEMPLGGFNEALGLEFVTVSADEVVLRVPIGPHLHQPYGIVHGGVWCGLVETAASVGAATWLGDKGNVVGVSNHTDFLKAVREGVVSVRATPIHRGRLQQLWLVEITDDSFRLVARGQVRLQNLESADGIGRSKG
jgi:1,4-dihydroxy-2-naphthoyl-CoA hydrolase